MPEKERCALATIFALLSVTVLAACRSQAEPITVEVTRVIVETVVKTVEVPVEIEVEVDPLADPALQDKSSRELTVCMPQEPATLYPYTGSMSLAQQSVLHGIFENDYTQLSFEFQPQGLEKLPSLADSDASITAVEVHSGDTVIDAKGKIITLKEGDNIVTSAGEVEQFDGTPLTMDQMVVDFTMKSRFWSDGTPVTAADSIFSLALDRDPDTPTSKERVSHTFSYIRTGELAVRWTGIPGFLDQAYFTNFWRPLPRHIWNKYSAAELLEAEVSSRLPVGDGPFKIVAWDPSESIRLEPNEFYYRADQGFPKLEGVTFRFIPDNDQLLNQLLLGKCDVVTHDGLDLGEAPLLILAESDGILAAHFQAGTVYEHIDFGIDSWRYYGDGEGRPDWFEDVRVRQAVTMCTDRQRMVDSILYGRSDTLHSYVPNSHPLYPKDLVGWPHDIDAANLLLNEVGFLDTNGDQIREDPVSGEPFRVRLDTTTSYEMNVRLARYFKEDLSECGIDVEVHYSPASQLLAPESEGPIFGRRFDLGHFAWSIDTPPDCSHYASWQITGPGTTINRDTGSLYSGWQGTNSTGWWDPAYDEACRAAMKSLPGTPGYETNHQQAQRILAENVPTIPLFPRLKVAATSVDVIGFSLDPTQPSELWNLFEIDLTR